MTNQFLQFEKLEACPGCGSNDGLTIVEREITQCDACQLYFRNPRPTQEEIARSYDTGGTFEAWQDEEPARARMWERRLKILQRYVSASLTERITPADAMNAAAKETRLLLGQ